MARHAEIEPRWLVSLLKRWAIRDWYAMTNSLGHVSGSRWMRGLKSSPSSSVDPTAYDAEDYTDVQQAIDWLVQADKDQWAAITMYYKPWAIQALEAEGFPFGAGNKTYYNRLHAGHKRLAEWMDNKRAERNDYSERARQRLAIG